MSLHSFRLGPILYVCLLALVLSACTDLPFRLGESASSDTKADDSRSTEADGAETTGDAGATVSGGAPTRDKGPRVEDIRVDATDVVAPSAACASGVGVVIGVDDDAATIVYAEEPGTTFIIESGIHEENFSVRPRDGDTFCGQADAILDGGGTLESAFHGDDGDNVTLDSFVVRNYNGGWQSGAIHPLTKSYGWIVRNITAVDNHWAGLLASDGMQILGGHYNDNGQLGISGNAATGVVLDGLDEDPLTIDGPEMARNRVDQADCGYEGGGMKWDLGQVTVRNAYVHDNQCRGLWADGNSHDALVEYNIIEDNDAEGILYEISQDAVIRNNHIYGNGHGGVGWFYSGGVTISSSFGVEVYGNVLSDNYNGITGLQQNRPDATPPKHLLDDFHVYDNTICNTTDHETGVGEDNGANLDARNIVIENNDIRSGSCRSPSIGP